MLIIMISNEILIYFNVLTRWPLHAAGGHSVGICCTSSIFFNVFQIGIYQIFKKKIVIIPVIPWALL